MAYKKLIVLFLGAIGMGQVLPDSVLIRLKEQGINPYAAPPPPPGTPMPLNLPESDCSGAIRICTNTYSYPGGIPSAGLVSELGSDGRGTCLAGGENRSVWFIFTVQTGGTLGFVICPNASSFNDYDFALWDVTGLQNPCAIFSGTGNVPAPIRCNFSVPAATSCCGGITCSNDGLTGLDHTNPQPGNLNHGPVGPPVMPGLNVNAGQTFLLVVDNWSDNNVGFTITFYGTAQYFDATPPDLDSAYTVCSSSYDSQLPALQKLRARFDELITPSSIAADGSDFRLIDNTTNTAVPITAAAPVNPPQTNTVELTLGQALVPGRSYTLHVAYNDGTNPITGTDGNTISDRCGIYITTTNIAVGSSATSYTFTVPDTMDIQVTLTPPRCVGTPTGQIAVQTVSPFGPHAYVLVSGNSAAPPATGWATTSTWTNRPAGTYTVWIRDARGCIQRRTVQLQDPTPVQLVLEDSLLWACGGQNTAFVQLNGSGGTPPYEFSVLPIAPTWQANGLFTGLSGGTYTLRVRDANGCIATRTIDIQQSPAVTLSLVAMDTIGCYGETGGFTVQAAGGFGTNYTYTLQPNGPSNTTGAFTGLAEGTYTVKAQDERGCPATLSVTLAQPDSLHVQDAQITSTLCLRDRNGAIQLTVMGGNPPYSYSWQDSAGNPLTADETLSALAVGTYTVTLTDRKGCTAGPYTYRVPYNYHAELRGFSYELVEDCPNKVMRYTVEATGVEPLSFVWTWEDGSQETTTSPTVQRSYSPLQGGTLPVKVEVRSGNACGVDTTVQVPFTACSGLLFPTAFTPNGDGINDRWVIQALGFQRYILILYDRWGGEVWTNGGNTTLFWDGRNKGGQELPEGAYIYLFDGVDNNGKTIRRSGTVTLLR